MPSKNDKSLAALAGKLAKKKVLVLGDAMLDRFVWGGVERISPEAPVPVLHVQREELLPGGAANVARNAAALGGKAVLISLAGDDRAGESLAALCRQSGVTARFVKEKRPTTEKVRFLAQSQQLLRADWEETAPPSPKTAAALAKLVATEAAKADIVIVSDYAKGVVTRETMDALRASGKQVIIDPKPSNRELYHGFFLMTPNHKEAAAIAHTDPAADPPLDAAKIITGSYTRHVLITRGAKGMYLRLEDGATKAIPTRARQVYDVTGAGDTVAAVFALALAARADIGQSAALANYAAGIVVGKVGTQTVTPEELRATVQEAGE